MVELHRYSRMLDKLRRPYSIKRFAVFLCAVFTLALSGCSAAEDLFLHRFGTMTEEDYQEYVSLRDSGKLDQDGHYMAPELDEPPEPSPPAGSVHVTFAKNAYIDVSYYLDPELNSPLAPDCYLMPGDRVYYDPEALVCRNPSSEYYKFDRFCIYAYDAAGNRGAELSWTCGGNDSQLVLQVPEHCTDTEVSVVPTGKYETRSLELTDYYTDSAGQHQELDGEWVVNDEKVHTQTVEVSPADPLNVVLTYDAEKYCYVMSEPSSYYHENGSVCFETTTASDAISRYSVELRSLEGTFLFDPAQYPVQHGTVRFEYQGRHITERTYIPDGGAIVYTAAPDAGYSHPKSTGQVIVDVSDPDETNAKIKEAVRFYSDEWVDVILPRPVGGTIEYRADGMILTGNKCTLPCGTVITMAFDNWNGWQHDILDGAEYIVTEQKINQAVSLESVDINTGLFKESNDHKPILNVVLTDSVKDAKFDISASGIAPEASKELSYAGGNKTTFIPDWLGANDRIIFSDKIGTDQGISLTVTNDTVFSGTALKLDIAIMDTNGHKSNYIRYVEKLPVKEVISLYDQREVATSSTVYDSVTITVSKVAVSTYASHTLGHAVVTAVLSDVAEPYKLKDGDVIEASRNVTIMITPQDGYYITGSSAENSTYSETMRYSTWDKDYQKILNKHPAKKLWYVMLVTSDSYGTCVYRLDGKEVSGKTGLHDGQKLTLEYTLTNSDYQIVRSGIGGFVGDLIHGNTETISIPVSEELDCRTVKRSDYITVQRKEG